MIKQIHRKEKTKWFIVIKIQCAQFPMKICACKHGRTYFLKVVSQAWQRVYLMLVCHTDESELVQTYQIYFQNQQEHEIVPSPCLLDNSCYDCRNDQMIDVFAYVHRGSWFSNVRTSVSDFIPFCAVCADLRISNGSTCDLEGDRNCYVPDEWNCFYYTSQELDLSRKRGQVRWSRMAAAERRKWVIGKVNLKNILLLAQREETPHTHTHTYINFVALSLWASSKNLLQLNTWPVVVTTAISLPIQYSSEIDN